MKSFITMWLNGFEDAVIIGVIFAVVLLLVPGCVQSDTRSTERTVTQTSPIVADTPVGTITIQPVRVERVSEGQSQTRTQADLSALAAVAPLVPGAGAVGGLAGLAGAAFGAWRMVKERETNKALAQTVEGVESFKARLDEARVQELHASMRSAMDEKVREKVHKIRKGQA